MLPSFNAQTFFNIHRFIYTLFTIFIFLSVNTCHTESFEGIIKNCEAEQEEFKGENMTGNGKNFRAFCEQDNAKEFKLLSGEEFKVYLPENPTTGYLWELLESSSSNIELISKKFLSPEDTGVVGSGGIRVLIFKAKKSGRATLYLGLKRPWEKDDKYINTYSLNLVVE